jgi:hypothetical protein
MHSCTQLDRARPHAAHSLHSVLTPRNLSLHIVAQMAERDVGGEGDQRLPRPAWRLGLISTHGPIAFSHPSPHSHPADRTEQASRQLPAARSLNAIHAKWRRLTCSCEAAACLRLGTARHAPRSVMPGCWADSGMASLRHFRRRHSPRLRVCRHVQASRERCIPPSLTFGMPR